MKNGPDPEGSGSTVSFLVEVCDPCIGTTYPVLPGAAIKVSDYCLPAYFLQNAYGPYTRCGQSIQLWTPEALVSDLGYITWSTSVGWWQYFEGSIHGPVAKDVLLADAMKTGVRGAVDRLPIFSRPPHLRNPKQMAQSDTMRTDSLFTSNQRLAEWVSQISRHFA